MLCEPITEIEVKFPSELSLYVIMSMAALSRLAGIITYGVIVNMLFCYC